LYQLNLLLPKAYEISTKSTVKSATRKVPNLPLLQWDTFLNDALVASSSINNTDPKFYIPEIFRLSVSSEDTTVDQFLRTMNEINNQRLRQLPKPERWAKRDQCCVTLGEPDAIRFRADNKEKLEDRNDTEIVAVVEVKPEQLMVTLIAGTEITDSGQVKLTDERDDLIVLYSSAVEVIDDQTDNYTNHEKIKRIICQVFGYMVINKLRYGMITTYARTWFLKCDDANNLYISPMIPIDQQHTESQASFLECMHYFEDISGNNPTIDSSQSPLMTDDDDDLDTSDQPSDNDKNDYYKPSKRQKTIESKYTSTWNTQKINTRGAKKANMEKFNCKSNDELLVNMKNYDYELFYFGKMLGFGRSGNVIEARLFEKSGALKMIGLYKDDVKLEEMLNEIKIYDIILKRIQGIYIPRLLEFGVLHEAFVFILTSFAGESFASKRRKITEVEKQLAINSLLAIHALDVKHGDIRLENIMVSRNSLTGHSCVWWVDFAWSKITDNAEVLKMELSELKHLLGTC